MDVPPPVGGFTTAMFAARFAPMTRDQAKGKIERLIRLGAVRSAGKFGVKNEHYYILVAK
jgi:hypothetical protein